MTAPRLYKPTTEEIQAAFVAALAGACCEMPSDKDLARKPLDVRLAPPLPRVLRAYLYAATSPPGERSVGDYKSQLMVSGQRHRQRGAFEYLSGVPMVLAGWAFEYDVWVLWDAGLHDQFGHSTNVQVKGATVHDAAAHGIACQVKRLRNGRGFETVVAAHSSLLPAAIGERLTVTAERVAGGGP